MAIAASPVTEQLCMLIKDLSNIPGLSRAFAAENDSGAYVTVLLDGRGQGGRVQGVLCGASRTAQIPRLAP